MKELPKIDLPEEWLIGTGVNKALLSLYTNFPCRLKSEIFVLCMEGEIEASVNLNRITVRANDFVTIMPGSILQIHSVNGEPILYFGGFSSKYIEQANLLPSAINTLFITIGRPVISLKPEGAKLLADYNKTRNVAWYAEKLKISNIHLCTTVKKVTGNTCVEIISHMVIMDAKSQLKSTNIPIQEISNSLNFANTSFFGKYFKRYVGMSPLAYRNSG